MSHIKNFHTEYIEKLRDEGNEVLVIARGDGADFDIPFEKKMLSRKNLACVKEIKRIIRAEKFDAIILNTSLAAFFIRLAVPKKERPRVVNIVHGYLFGKNTGFIKRNILLFCERIVKKKTDTVIVMNAEDFAIAREYKLAVRNLKMSRGMGASVKEPEQTAKEIRSSLSAADAWVMVFVGELSGRKNQKMLISAMPKIKESIPNATLWLVGDGGEREALAALAKSKGVLDSVQFLGRRDNPCDFIRAADLYVSASKIEGMPFNIMEALGCGAAVLASSVKGHEDLIEEGLSGYLFPEDDVDIFVSKAIAIKRGLLPTNSAEARAVFEKYEKSAVFEETYLKIKESIEK